MPKSYFASAQKVDNPYFATWEGGKLRATYKLLYKQKDIEKCEEICRVGLIDYPNSYALKLISQSNSIK